MLGERHCHNRFGVAHGRKPSDGVACYRVSRRQQSGSVAWRSVVRPSARRRGLRQNTLDMIFECALFILGLAFGSFLNVCITRIPRDLSIITPGSHCPACGAPIRWHDNIPVLSWGLLRGRCGDCRARISLRYPAVELLFMDAETCFLPREFSYPGIVLGLAFSWIFPTDSSATQFFLRAYEAHLSPVQVSLLDAGAGALAGAGFFFVASGLYFLIRKRQGMGNGDFALTAMAGAFLGLKLTLFVIFLAPVMATVYALIWMVRQASDASRVRTSLGQTLQSWEVPFGVFISASSLGAVFVGGAVWQWYLSFF